MTKTALLSGLTLSLALGFNLASPAGAIKNTAELPDVPAQALINTNSKDGPKALQMLMDNIKSLGPYKFEGLLTTKKPDKVCVDSGNFYFMPSSQLRVEVMGKGFKAGSILVKDKTGTIKAKGGRSLLGMKMTLEPDSNMLQLPNGLNILKCDLLSLVNWLQSQVSSGQKVYCSEAPLQVASMATKVYVLEAHEPSGALSHRVLVDPQLKVPIEWDIFRDGKFFSAVKFTNFQVVPAMDDSLFKL